MRANRRTLWTLLGLLFVALHAPKTVTAAPIPGGDLGGADLVPGDGDVLSGTFTNVGLFHVPAGITVYVEPGVPLSIQADRVLIEGTLDGTGAGYAGGPSRSNPSQAGLPGSGPGAGAGGGHGGCVHASGGGGGGHGGAGGSSGSYFGVSPPPAPGGVPYGTASGSDLDMGSGGGAGGNHCAGYPDLIGGAGGAGGGAVTLTSLDITVDGVIVVDGAAGTDGTSFGVYPGSSGGGGAGGGVILCGAGTVGGVVSARGGDGGDGLTSRPYGQGGGGGGGGRVKLSPGITVTGAILVTGGVRGTSAGSSATPAQDGSSGTSVGDLACAVPLSVSCTSDAVLECASPSGTPLDLAFTLVENLGQDVTVEVFVDGASEQSTVVPGGAPGTTTILPFSSAYAPGSHPVEVVATNASGDEARCSLTVTVLDTTPPQITCPPDQVVEATSGAGAVVVFAPPTVTDGCDGDPTVTCVPPSGSTFPLGTTLVTCTAADDAGNSTSCSFLVTVRDTTPPAVTCTIAKSVLWPATKGLIGVGHSVSATDAVDPAPEVFEIAVYSDEGNGTDAFTPDATFAAGVLRLRSERSTAAGADGRWYLVVARARDDAGNVGHACCTVIVPLTLTSAHMAARLAEAATIESACEAGGGSAPPGALLILTTASPR